MELRYCPKCKSLKPMMKAGTAPRKSGYVQMWKCRNKRCNRITANPLRSKE